MWLGQAWPLLSVPCSLCPSGMALRTIATSQLAPDMNGGHCPSPGLHLKAFHCGMFDVGSRERDLSPFGRETAFLRSGLFSVLNSRPVAEPPHSKDQPQMEAAFLGLHHYNRAAT